jgi:hypothetical protein
MEIKYTKEKFYSYVPELDNSGNGSKVKKEKQLFGLSFGVLKKSSKNCGGLFMFDNKKKQR